MKTESKPQPTSGVKICPLRTVSEIGEFDVVLGRGTGPNENPGNRLFRETLKKYCDEYRSASARLTRREVIYTAIKDFQSCGGRFLERVSSPGDSSKDKPKNASDSNVKSNAKGRFQIVEGTPVFLKARQAFRYLLRENDSKRSAISGNTTSLTGTISSNSCSSPPLANPHGVAFHGAVEAAAEQNRLGSRLAIPPTMEDGLQIGARGSIRADQPIVSSSYWDLLSYLRLTEQVAPQNKGSLQSSGSSLYPLNLLSSLSIPRGGLGQSAESTIPNDRNALSNNYAASRIAIERLLADQALQRDQLFRTFLATSATGHGISTALNASHTYQARGISMQAGMKASHPLTQDRQEPKVFPNRGQESDQHRGEIEQNMGKSLQERIMGRRSGDSTKLPGRHGVASP